MSELKTDHGYKIDLADKNLNKYEQKSNNNFLILKTDLNRVVSNLQRDLESNSVKFTS